MNIINKNYVAPAPKATDPLKHRAAVLAVLAALPVDKAALSADEVRAAAALNVDALPDGAIHQIAIDAGYKVEV